jgi:hypothetical protein
MSSSLLEELAQDCCRIFLGWKLREDFDALRALGEGSLRIDLRSGEAWCDDEPLPPLFIAGELKATLEKTLERAAIPAEQLREARLEVLFAASTAISGGRQVPTLKLACRSTIATATQEVTAEANNSG